MKHCRMTLCAVLACVAAGCVTTPSARGSGMQLAGDIPAPSAIIGHQVGADYKLARWEKIVEYFDLLGQSSDRVNVRRIGETTEGNPYLLCEISSAETIARLDEYRALQARIADPRMIANPADRDRVQLNAKTTIIVTCGLHSTEVAASQMSMELAYDLAVGNDPRTREILDNCIILLVPCANPDGLNKVVDWYEAHLGTQYEGGWMPWLYQKYGGHDNNRDWFMLNLKETRLLTRVLYHEWHPTILYDIHQMGNRGPRFFVPPFFDPVNPNVDPLIHQSLLIIGGHMATELQERGKTGVVFKAIYDNWWQGGNRTTPYRHNVVGILTEAASAKIASPVFKEHGELRGGYRGMPDYSPAVNFPEPWPGGWWRLRDIVDYEKIACNALFTLAARYRDRFVANHMALSDKALRLGAEQPPYAWLVPPRQRDPGAATHMLEILQLSGIEVHRATAPFQADGVEYPADTYVMLASQPYRNHLKDMMERQEYPERRQYPGGPAESPYDAAGWTLPLQMGVTAIEVAAPFDGLLERVAEVKTTYSKPVVADTDEVTTWALNRHSNDHYRAANRLMADGEDLFILAGEHPGAPIGSLVFRLTSDELARLSKRVPANLIPLSSMPDDNLIQQMRPPRTALYQPWTSSMDEGWTRFVLEEFDFPYTTIHNAAIRAGNLGDRFDCIILPDQSLKSILNGVSDKRMPPPYSGGIGLDGAMQLERFVQQGGTLVLLDSATELATDLYRVPVRNVLDDLPNDEFFCPGSLLRIRVDSAHPLGYGFADEAAAYFSRSQAFVTGKAALQESAGADGSEGQGSKGESGDTAPPSMTDDEIEAKLAAQPVTTVARYADNIVLLSGWILGDDHLRNRAAVCEVQYGAGRIVLFGFRVQHRGQPHGTFKFLFNAIYRSTLKDLDDG